jgi:PKD repeat protein
MSILKVNVTPVAPADTTAPVLSDLTAAASGATGWTGSVVMDEPGTLYYLVNTSASATDVEVKAGSSVSVTQAGSVALNGTGLTAETTYYLHVLGADDEDTPNESAVSSSDSFTTEATGSATGTVTISSFRQNNLTVAPFAVTFEARVTGATVTENLTRSADDPSYDGLVYIWDFGEGGAKTVNSNAVNLPSAWNNMNVAYGKRPAHVYETPGTYTVTCTCRELDGTLVGTDTFQVTVQDPDDVFTGSRTILVGSADANYPGATVTGSFSTAWNALKGLGQPGRILVARGSDLTVGVNLTTSNANQNVYVGAYGIGADPILRTGSSGANKTPMFASWNGFNSDFTFWNLDLRGDWDSTNETGKYFNGVVFTMGGSAREATHHLGLLL